MVSVTLVSRVVAVLASSSRRAGELIMFLSSAALAEFLGTEEVQLLFH